MKGALVQLVSELHTREEGHTQPLVGYVVAAAGIIALGIGAANDTSWLTIGGAIVGGVGVLAGFALGHHAVDADIYGRIEKLEKK